MSIPILMPALSPTMEEGKLAKWHVKPGDKVRSGDVIAEIETDKATMEVEAVDEGVVAELLVVEGAEGIKVNAVIAQLRDEGETYVPGKASAPVAMKTIAAPPAAPRSAGVAKPAGVARVDAGARVFASPLARRVAAQGGVELRLVQGTGPHGRVVKADVDEAAKAVISVIPASKASISGATASVPSPIPDARLYFAKESYQELPHDSMRKTIARRLSESKFTAPHFYLTMEINMDNAISSRVALKAFTTVDT